MKVLLWIGISIYGLCAPFTVAGEQLLHIEPYFEHIANEQGLSNVTVKDIAQDAQGYLWFATDDGLNRFDGYSFKVYRPVSGDESSIAHFRPNVLLVNSSNQLLVGTPLGLELYDESQDSFLPVSTIPEIAESLSGVSVTALFEDKDNNLWVGTARNGLKVVDFNLNQVTDFSASEDNERKLSSNFITVISQTKNGKIWVGTRKGVNVIDSNNFKVATNFQFKSDSRRLIEDDVWDVLITDQDDIWLGSNKGLSLFNINTGKFESFFSGINQENNASVQIIEEGPDGQLWLGTRNGLILFDPATKKYVHYQHKENKPESLGGQSILSIFKDREGLFWFGSYAKGIDKYNPEMKRFGHHVSSGNDDECLSGNLIYSSYIDSYGDIWLGANGKGLHRIDRKNSHCYWYRQGTTNLEAVTFKSIVDIYEDAESNLWFATLREGLIQYNRSENHFRQFLHNKDENSISSNYTRSVTADHLGNIWVGSYREGLSRYNIRENTFTSLTGKHSESFSFDRNVITSLVADKKNNLWVGTSNNGLLKIEQNSNSLIEFQGKNSLFPPNVSALAFDQAGSLWLGSAGYGLYHFDIKTEELIHFSTEQGLASNFIYHIEIDNQRNAWASSSAGLSRIEFDSGKIANFTRKDGLQNNEFTSAGSYHSKTDEMLFAGINGYNLFNPQGVFSDVIPPRIAINQLQIFNKDVQLKREQSDSVLSQTINTTRQLNLDYDQTVFGFEYVGLNYLNPKQTRYAYQLVGYDDDWIYVDSNRRYVSYSNLDAGNYTFQLKASNKNGVWSEEPKSIAISIASAPWRTWWAYLLYAVFTIAIMTTVIWLSWRKKVAQQEKLSALEVAKAKDRLFTNVSHEFRTPLTLMLSPIELMLKSNPSETTRSKLMMMKRNGQRLSKMVDQFLEMARLDSSSSEETQIYELKSFIQSLHASFQSLLDAKNLSLEVNISEEISLSLTRDSLEIIVTNLLSNAVKYTPNDGKIMITAERTNDDLILSISDTGPGISLDNQPLVFERFTRLNDESTESIQGTGIGLALVKEIVERNDGKITLESELGKGSCFKVYLPMEKISITMDSVELSTTPISSSTELEIKVLRNSDSSEQVTKTDDSLTQDFQLKTDIPENSAHEKTILFIDDNRDMRELLLTIFKPQFHCLVANNGTEGLNLASSYVPDIIICDLMMPGISGYEVASSLKQNEMTSHIPIIMLTAKGGVESRMKGWKEKIDDYLTKPFHPDELQLRVQNILDIRSILRKRFGSEITQGPGQPGTKQKPTLVGMSDKDSQFIEKFTKIIDENFTCSEFNREQVAKELGVSERQLNRKLSALIDHNFSDYIKKYRLNRSVELFSSGRQIAQISEDVGFSSPSYYIRCFKAEYGKTPKQYQEETIQR
ncbi:hybrid sensor histidine kinase/response regulator transcription factor [Aliikangiella coralliicola]|uniref:histidine kinase n=1 Tax=Aliikangiella coralliicola TaxID=2592383 RepID=A0A545U6G6_9GAMM|nr:hybrid sensor histidine kinase/response regulator transcription factor [Aliikangiella coralliicola]TQV85068.1 response regulator [Aliikangiella coralliicola]